MSTTLTEGAAVRVRGLNKGRPFHAVISKVYKNGKDVGVKFVTEGAIARFGKGQMKVGVDSISLI